MIDRRMHDRGRRIEDCSPLLGLTIMTLYGVGLGFVFGFIIGRVW